MKLLTSTKLVIFTFFIFLLQLLGATEWILLDQSRPFEIYRYVSAIFAHGSISHILFNMFGLLIFGAILEHIIGSRKFLYTYLGIGILGNLIGIFFYSKSLGASGAVMGILGLLAVLRPQLVVWLYGIPMRIWFAAIIWVLIDTVGLFVPSGIANIVHLVGLGIGVLLGFTLFSKYRYHAQVQRDPQIDLVRWENIYLRK